MPTNPAVKAELHKGDIGTVFRVTVKDQDDTVVNISAASVKKLIFKKPSGAVVEKDATFTTTGADGRMQYTTVADDLDQVGTWSIQGYVELADGKWHTNVLREMVHSNLQSES